MKNYYELEKEKLESKLASDKERYEKKLQEVVREYEARLQEETTVQEEEFEAMQENFANEIGQLKEIINSLQHDVDIKAKAAENSERRLAEEKNKF